MSTWTKGKYKCKYWIHFWDSDYKIRLSTLDPNRVHALNWSVLPAFPLRYSNFPSLFQNACCLYPWFPGLSHINNYFSNILLLLRSCLCMICWFQIFFLLLRFAWWRHQMETFPRYWPFVRGIPRSPFNSRHKCQWCGASMFSFICTWTKGLNKQSRSRWFETSSRSLWLHWNVQTWLCPV